MGAQFDQMAAENAAFYVQGDAPNFGSVYADEGSAKQASQDWSALIFGGISKIVDKEINHLYEPKDNILPKQENGSTAGSTGELTMKSALPWLGGALVLAVIVFALRK